MLEGCAVSVTSVEEAAGVAVSIGSSVIIRVGVLDRLGEIGAVVEGVTVACVVQAADIITAHRRARKVYILFFIKYLLSKSKIITDSLIIYRFTLSDNKRAGLITRLFLSNLFENYSLITRPGIAAGAASAGKPSC